MPQVTPPLTVALAMMVAVSSSAPSARANDITVFQRGNAEAQVETWGANNTHVMQMGGGRVLLNVQGNDNETYVISGKCPAGSHGAPIEIRGNRRLNIKIAHCHGE